MTHASSAAEAAATRAGSPGPTNGELMDCCRAGDRRAWETLVTRYERLVYAIPLRLGLGRDDAADIAQETFTTLLRSLDRINDPGSLASWLMTVARRLSWRRRAGTSSPWDGGEMPEPVVDPNDDLVQSLWVYEAVESLGDPCSSVIRHLFFDPDEPSYAEIATRLGYAIGTVGSLRIRCLDRLRTILEADSAT